MPARKILLIDDSIEFRTKVRETLGSVFSIEEADSLIEFERVFRPYAFDLVILDMRLQAEREGLDVLRRILAQDELQPVIMVSAYGDTDAVLDATEGGALMFLHKQEFTPELLGRMVEAVLQQARIRRHLASLQNRIKVEDPLALTMGNDLVRRAAKQVEAAADDPGALVFVSGEAGAGQDLAAAGVHARSAKRSVGPFVVASGSAEQSVNPQEALFGSNSMSPTQRSKGAIEEANWGLLYVDQADALPENILNELLDAVGRKSIQSDASVTVDVQLVLGCSESGRNRMSGQLRRQRVSSKTIEVTLPALRERREDVPLLAAYFLQELRKQGRTTAQAFSREALRCLETWGWPGNLHELRAAVDYGGVQAWIDQSGEIERRHLPKRMIEITSDGDRRFGIYRQLAQVEAALVAEFEEKHRDLTKEQIAKELGYTSRTSFSRRMRQILAEYPDLGRDYPRIAGMFS